jgi:hypothetical protein
MRSRSLTLHRSIILRSGKHALRGSFGWSRALDATIEQEAQRATRRLTMPVLAIGGHDLPVARAVSVRADGASAVQALAEELRRLPWRATA